MQSFATVASDSETPTREAASTFPTRVTTASPADIPAVVAMMQRCSRISLLHRFHGPTDGVAFTVDRLKRNNDVVALAWEGARCIGMGTLAPHSDGAFHLAVLVEDDWQRQRIGTRLVTAVTQRAKHRGVRSVHADVMGVDRWALAVLRRLGLTRVVLDHGTFSVDVDLV
jgi:GNAT superfamily N-acetyltransferase